MGEANQSAAKTEAAESSTLKPSMEEEEDRISDLPEAIILHILSFLPAQDCVKTGLLSKRWKYLWAHVPNLTFHLHLPIIPTQTETETETEAGNLCDYDGFFGFIDKTLTLYSSGKINKLSLLFDYNHVPSPTDDETATVDSRLSLWLRFASMRQMEELKLELATTDFENYLAVNRRYVMPKFVYDNPCLTKLYSSGCEYPPLPLGVGGVVSWGSLKELVIIETEFQDGVLQMMLSGTPLLEYLELGNCKGLSNIDTASNIHLHTLRLLYVQGVNLELSIPAVQSLEILGYCLGSQFKLVNVSSLLDAKFDFVVPRLVTVPTCCCWVYRLFEAVVNRVVQLTVGTWCLQVLSELLSEARCPPLSVNKNCKCLILSTCFEEKDFLGVASLLRSLPNLEELVVDNDNRYSDKFHDASNSTVTDYWTSLAGSFHCLDNVLKTIRIVGLEPQGSFHCLDNFLKTIQIVGLEPQGRLLIYNHDGLLDFIKFLLRRAKVLEKLVILAPPQGTYQKMDNYDDIAQKLLSFPKSSPRAVVLLPQ